MLVLLKRRPPSDNKGLSRFVYMLSKKGLQVLSAQRLVNESRWRPHICLMWLEFALGRGTCFLQVLRFSTLLQNKKILKF